MEEVRTFGENPTEKQREYLAYISEHCANVVRSYSTLKERLKVFLGLSNQDMRMLYSNIITHDLSKYTDEEFEAYRNNFYPEEGEKVDKEKFELAWQHHYKMNPHHWEHWVNFETKETQPIPPLYIAELICDWNAMSIKFGGNPLKYYESKKNDIILHPQTRKDLKRVLNLLYKD